MKQKLTAIILFTLLLLCQSVYAMAEVNTVEEQTAGDTVYIAGNPDLYPVEYYDKDKKVYKGMMPDLYNEISEKTGIKFSYIYAGENNQQKRIAKNKQAEIISVHFKGEAGEENDEYYLFSFNDNKEKKDVFIGFTSIADENTVRTIKKHLDSIPESDLLSLSIRESYQENSKINWPILIIPTAILLVIIVILIIIIVKKRMKERQRQQSELIDSFTGIGNNESFKQSYIKYVSPESNSLYYIAYIAVDTMRILKYAGVSLLEEIQRHAANVLSSSKSDNDFTARIKDGVFLLAFRAESQEQAENKVNELLLKLNNFDAPDENEYRENFHIGVFHLDSSGISFETAYINAENGYNFAVKNKIPFYFTTRKMLKDEDKKAKLQKKLFEAINNNEIDLYFQFIVDSQSSEIRAAEILSRWYNSESGLIRPSSYIEPMISAGIIDKHDFFVFEKTCKLLEDWSKTDKGELCLSCNFTRHTISREDFAERFEKIIRRYSFKREKLIVELTEDSIEDNQAIAYSNVVSCKKLGVRIALDDLGNGCTSLGDICDYPIDIIKIDRNLVIKASTDRGYELLKGIIRIAHNLNINVICEGVEDDTVDSIVKNAGCDFIQGYYYSRVLPIEEADNYFLKFQGNK